MSKIQAHMTQEILLSIAKQGLLPRELRANSPCLVSGDEAGKLFADIGKSMKTDYLCLNEINLKGDKDCSQQIKPLMDEMSAGIWPVTLERSYKLDPHIVPKKEDLKTEFESRLAATVVLVFKPQKVKQELGIKKPIYASLVSEDVLFHEVRTYEAVKISDLVCVLAPAPLTETAQKIFLDVPVLSVDNTKGKVAIPMFEVEKYWPSKFMATICCTLKGPNYTKAFETMVNTHHLKSFCCHAVRLPTLKDVEFGLATKKPEYLNMAKKVEAMNKTDAEVNKTKDQEGAQNNKAGANNKAKVRI